MPPHGKTCDEPLWCSSSRSRCECTRSSYSSNGPMGCGSTRSDTLAIWQTPSLPPPPERSCIRTIGDSRQPSRGQTICCRPARRKDQRPDILSSRSQNALPAHPTPRACEPPQRGCVQEPLMVRRPQFAPHEPFPSGGEQGLGKGPLDFHQARASHTALEYR